METFLIVMSVITLLIGAVTSAIPGLPGTVISFFGLLALYFLPTTGAISVQALLAFGIVAVVLSIVNNFIPLAAAKSVGASKYAIYGGLTGLFLGIFFVPPFGAIVGVFLGAVIGELFTANDLAKALNAGIGTLVGLFFAQLLSVAFSLTALVYGLYLLIAPLVS